MSEAVPPITELLGAVDRGECDAWSQLFAAVYDELGQLARGRLKRLRPGDTLRTADLVHESYLKLLGASSSWSNRRHFFGAASRAMRDILVDEARRRGRLKRGGDRKRWELGDDIVANDERPGDLLALDEALRRLASEDDVAHNIVMLRYFAGLPQPEIATLLEVSPSTVDRRWRFARAWLLRELRTE